MADESQELIELVVGAEGAGRRLDAFVAGCLARLSRAKVQRLVERGDVTLNGEPARSKDALRVGDRIVVALSPVEPSRLAPVEMPLAILYEDEHLIVVDKPSGISVHPGAGTSQATLVQALIAHVGKMPAAATRDPMAALRPGVVHRLDKDTTGAMVLAKTDLALAHLAKQFHDKTDIMREYVALLDGVMPRDEIIHESYLFRDPRSRLRFASMTVAEMEQLIEDHGGRKPTRYRLARSAFKRATVFGGRLTLARVRLFTGRTHQIRVHAKDLGLPVVGDLVYHRPTELPQTFPEAVRLQVASTRRQMLHARLLGFRHPTTGETMRFEAPYPADFAVLLQALRPFAESPDRP